MGKSILLKSIENDKDKNEFKAILSVQGSIDSRISLEQDLTITRDSFGRWHATIALDDFPLKETPEEAADRLSQWLLCLSKSVKGRYIKRFNLKGLCRRNHFN